MYHSLATLGAPVLISSLFNGRLCNTAANVSDRAHAKWDEVRYIDANWNRLTLAKGDGMRLITHSEGGLSRRRSIVAFLFFIVFAGFWFFLNSSGCQKNPVVPPDDLIGMKDPRSYTWTIDTLSYPGSYQTAMINIWGKEANDLYVVGHNDQNRGLMFHYDGKSWTPVTLTVTEGGSISGPIDLYSIHGFDSTHIFAIGKQLYTNPSPPPNLLDTSLVLEYNGSGWTKSLLNGRFLLSIWGDGPTNLWVGGWEGTLFHYDGLSWEHQGLPISPPSGYSDWQVKSITGFSADNVYCLLYAHVNSTVSDSYYFLTRRSGSWALIDSFVNQPGLNEAKWGDTHFWMSPWQVLYSSGNGIFRWDGLLWEKIFVTNGQDESVFGTSQNNLFVTSSQSELFHFNGNDWYKFDNLVFQGVTFVGGWANDKGVFVLGWLFNSGPLETIILHGK